MKRVLKKARKTVAFVIVLMMLMSVITDADVSAKQKYKTIEEDGKEYIVFGSYEQDGDESDGKEPIEWEVLGEDKNGILVVSRYVLDWFHHKRWESAEWKNSTLRAWLNKKFYKAAFNKKEQKKICTVKVVSSDNPNPWGGEGGGDTKDKVFLLSLDELLNHYSFNYYGTKPTNWGGEEYWGCCQELIVPATAYAKNKGVYGFGELLDEYDYKDFYKKYGYTKDCIGCEGTYWWLRTVGENESRIICVGYDGYINTKGQTCEGQHSEYHAIEGVRPALYLKK